MDLTSEILPFESIENKVRYVNSLVQPLVDTFPSSLFVGWWVEVEMDFLLKGWLKFNRSLDEADIAILAEIIKQKVPEQFIRGVPKGKKGSRIVNWKIRGNILQIEIEGTRYLRPHDALLRLKNLLLAELSRRRLGIRDLKVEEYRIKTDVEIKPSDVRKILGDYAEVLSEKPLVIAFKDLKEEDIKSRLIDRALAELTKAIEEEAVPKGELVPVGTILLKTIQKPYATENGVPIDPSNLAIKKGWIKRFPGRGQWVITSPMARLLRVLKEMIEDHILIPLGFQEWMFPKLIPWDVYERMPGYFEHLAEGLMYVCHAGRDPEALKEFKLEARLKKKADPSLVRKELEGPTHILAAAQCEPFYQFFSGEITPEEVLPVKVYDASGWTYRWEGGGVEGLLRTVEFFRLEVVWLGTPEQVVDIRWDLADKTFNFLDKVLDLEVRMTVGAPFYMTTEQAQERLVDISGEKYPEVPTLDIEAYLPYKGSREEAEWLEINGINVHKKKYVDSFKIKANTEVWTGCNGYGLTRYLVAFLARHGFEPERWPREVRERYEGSYVPKTPKLITWP